ncbi:MAG: hypothetical protein LLF94_04630 [Chlamydiales bacterium]|nr:hypothetical protein [Chlamydiales bacterium]
MRVVALLLALVATSCSQPPLTVETGYFTRKDLASSHVGTPDPTKQQEVFGQRIYIAWNLSKQEYAQGQTTLHIQARLKKGGILTQDVPLDAASGRYIFPIVGDNYSKKGGLLSYKVELLSNGKPLATSSHKFWVEEIHFSE